jgi:WD40 repeat protein
VTAATTAAGSATESKGTPLRGSPYVGLVPYSEADAEFFFGRENDTEIIAANIKTSRLTLLYGASGVGKSSVLLAGVVPRLRELGRERVDGKPALAVVVFRSWRRPPLPGLIEAIREGVSDALGEPVDPPNPSSPFTEVLWSWTAGVRSLLIVLDQFEDYFLYHAHEDGSSTFATEFPRVINDAALRVNVLVSLREDAWAKLDRFEGRIPNLFSNYLRVDHLDWEAAGRAITRPIEEFNKRLPDSAHPYTIEPVLVDTVRNQVKTGHLALADSGPVGEAVPAQLATPQIETPFLQLVLERLWRATVDSGSYELTVQTLTTLGGAEKIVKTYLAETLHALDQSEQEIAAELFRYLITPSKTKIAHRTSDLAFWTKRSEADLEPVLDKLSRAQGDRIRILRPIALPAGEQGSMYEIFHDVLAEPILEWRTQHDQEREKTELAARLRAEQAQRDKESRNRRIRTATIALLILVPALVALTAIALVQKRHATQARKVADSRALAADAFTRLAVDPAASVQEAARAARIKPTAEAEGALRAGLADSFLHAVLRGDTAALTSSRFSPDSRRVLTSSEDHSVRVWDTSGRLLATLRGHTAPVVSAAFSRDGKRVIAGGTDGTALIWNTSGGRPVVLSGHSGSVVAGLSPDGKFAATGGADGLAGLWDQATGKKLATLRGHTGPVTAVAFSPNSKRLVTASADGARVWSVPTARLVAVLRGHADAISALSFRRDGKLLLTASGDEARLWKIGARKAVAVLRGHTGDVSDAAFSPDGRFVLTAGSDKTARIWSLHGQQLLVLHHDAPLRRAAFSPNGKLIVTASEDATARVWDATTGTEIAVLKGHTAALVDAAFSPDGKEIVTASNDQTARVWAAPKQPTLAVLRSSPKQRLTSNLMLAAAFDPDDRVVTVGADGSVRIWSHSRDRIEGRTATGSASVAGFNADGRRAAIVGGDGTTYIWDVLRRRLLARLHTTGVVAATLSDDGEFAVTSATDGTARVIDVASRRTRMQVRTELGSLYAATLNPEHSLLVTGANGKAEVWEVPSGRRVAVLLGHTGPVLAVAFSADGKLLATAGFDGTTRLWDSSNWRGLAVLHGHEGPVLSVTLGKVGRVVATTGADGTTRIWETSSGTALAVLRGHTKRVLSAAFSADGRRVVTASQDGTARIYACDLCGSLAYLLTLARQVPGT